MIAVYFRFIDPMAKPTGWVGMAFAKNKEGLFELIDQHGNPYSCLIKKVDLGSVCCFESETNPAVEACDEFHMGLLEEDGWEKWAD